MGDARNKRRHEAKQKARNEKDAVYIPLVVTFRDIGAKNKQSVVLYCSNDPDPVATDDNTIAVLPVRGKLTNSRKEDIVLKFITLASACILEPDEEEVSDWKITKESDTERVIPKPRPNANLWPSFLKDVVDDIEKVRNEK